MSATPHWENFGVALFHGDSIEVLRTMPAASVDAVVTDPPYGLAELGAREVAAAMTAWLGGDRTHVPDGRGFMGRSWDRFVPPPGLWDECFRVLKPGGHVLAFAGSRTADLMGISIRLAGFEIRDTITWMYGSGFPKSLDVSKAIDKAAGATREVVGTTTAGQSSLQRVSRVELGYRSELTAVTPEALQITAPATETARQWAGWGTALKPASEPIIVARKPLEGTVASNVQTYGTGALNIDGSRTGTESMAVGRSTGEVISGNGSMAGPNTGREVVGYVTGRWPANVVLTHAEIDGRDACLDGCVPGCPVAELDAQSGVMAGGNRPARRGGIGYGSGAHGTDDGEAIRYDGGGASRFFPTFRYQAKAPSSERPRADGTAHPTVKPVELMRWLVKLVTPPDGLVLDPFAGSGTTGEAALTEGFRATLIELEASHLPLIVKRLSKGIQPVLDF